MTSSSLARIVRASALYDLVVTIGFAFFFTAPALFAGLGSLHDALGLPGSVPDAGDPYVVMFANLMGSLVVVWAAFRLLRPTRAAGAADTVGRLLFSTGMIAALVGGASPLVVGMLIPELAWAVVQGVAVARGGAISREARRGAVVGSTRADR